MIRIAATAALLGGALFAFCGITLGHGGTYRGPGDTVPTTPGGPHPTTPPNPGVPTPPGVGPVGPANPAPPGVPTPPPVGGTPTPVGPGPIGTPNFGPDVTSWTFWWAFNRDQFLQLKAQVHKLGGILTADSPDAMAGAQSGGHESMRPTLEQIERFALPALTQALETSTNRDVLSGALLALAKIGVEPDRAVKIFTKFLTSRDQELAETAALAFGILADPAGLPILRDLFEDNEAGRRAAGTSTEVSFRTRAFACYGLGLTAARTNDADARRQVQTWLVDFLGKASKSTDREVLVAAVISLGLIPDPDRRAVPVLDDFLVKHRAKLTLVCAHVPNAVGRLLRDASVEERQVACEAYLRELEAEPRGKEKDLRASFAQAVGLLTRDGEPHAARAFAVVKSKIDGELSKNPILGYFGMIALGQLAGSGESNGPVEKYLVEKSLTRGGNTQTRAWSAIALGVAAFRQLERGVRLDDAVGNELLTRLQALRDGSSRAAFALSLGLRRHAASALELRRCLDEVKDDDWRGYFATALGLLGDRGAIPRIQELVKASTRRPETLRESAIALGLLGDKETVPVLVAVLRSADSNVLAVQAAVASALGTIGDYRALRPLADTLTDSKGDLTEGARAFAAAALGIVCDKEEYPWNFKISTDLNYTATVSTLNDQAMQSGILNLL